MTSLMKIRPDIDASVYLVADHLDAALAAGEDLVAVARTWPLGDAADPGVAGARRFVVGRMRTHEMSMLARIVQARSHMRALAQADALMRPLAQLFLATTRDLAAVLCTLEDAEECAFHTGEGTIAFLRARGLIGEEAPGLAGDGAIVVTDEFRMAGVAPLGVIMDLLAEFIEALEAQYDLYPADAGAEADAGIDAALSADGVLHARDGEPRSVAR
ncbi:MAG: hypothetical protein NW205_06220 [Hyphomicrobiaceae bacterium]|nr:hypothetical protein [Hyphomicrobiaceae bacterium]